MPTIVPSVDQEARIDRNKTDDEKEKSSHSGVGDSESSGVASSQVSANGTSDFDAGVTPSKKWEYVWMAQHHSLQHYPPQWTHPLTLLTQHCQNTANEPKEPKTSEEEEDDADRKEPQNKEKLTEGNEWSDDACAKPTRELRRILGKDFSDCVYTPVPSSLPQSCRNQHKHRWNVSTNGKCFSAKFLKFCIYFVSVFRPIHTRDELAFVPN